MSVSSDSALSEHAPTTSEASAPRGRDLPTPGQRRRPTPGAPRIEPTDGELLSLFTRHDDRDALDRLIDRHAPMVWRVCRQSLRRQQDAEDAFQATFLLLIKNANSIQSSDSAAGWLYRVAYRTSIRARKQLAARREESLSIDPDAPSEKAFPDLLRKQTTSVLVEELMRLPAKYQTALVLRYLEGQSRRAIADQTDTTVAAVQGQLARGKQLLRRRLLQRGVSLSAAMAALGLAGRGAQAAETAPVHVVAQTTTNGVALATGGSLAASAAVVSLYQEGVRAMLLMWIAKPAGVAASLAAVALLAMAPGAGGETPAATPSAVLQLAVDLPSERESSIPGVEPTERITLAQANTNRDEARYTETHHVAELIEAMRVLKPESSEKQLLSSLANRLRQEVLDDDDEVGIFAANQSLVISGNGDKQKQVAILLAKIRAADSDLAPVATRKNNSPPNELVAQLNPGNSAPDPAGAALASSLSPVGESKDTTPVDPDAEATEKVLAVFRRPLPEGGLDFPEGTPLEEVIDYLATEFDVDYDFDRTALDDYGIRVDEPVSIHRRRGTIGAALEQMLEPLKLRAISHNGVLRVTTAVQAAKQLEVQVYSVADLLNANGVDAEQLAQTVTRMVEPGTWAEDGTGQAELTLMSGGVLTVSQSQRGHERLVELLNSLREVSAATSGKTARTRTAPTVTAQPGATGVVRRTAPYGGGLTATTTPQPGGSAELRVQTTEAMPKAEPFGTSLRPPVPDGPRVKYAQRNREYGWSVNQLQERLNKSLDPSPDLQSDGDYGPKTTAAVKRFQKEKGLPETGFADQATRAALGFVTQSLSPTPPTASNSSPAIPDYLLDALVNDAAGPKLGVTTAQRLIDETDALRLGLSEGQAQRAARVFASLRGNTALQPDMKGFERDAKLFRTTAGSAWSSGPIESSAAPSKPLDPRVLAGALQRSVQRMRERASQARAAGDSKAYEDAMQIVRRTEDDLKRKLDELGGSDSLASLMRGLTLPTADESVTELLTASLEESRRELAADEAAGETFKVKRGKRYIELVKERLDAIKTASRSERAKPTVIQTVPARGATNVDPALKEIRVTFDRDMRPNGYSFSGMPKPHDGRKPRWISNRTCILPVELQPGLDYWVGINADGRTSFKSADGTPASFDELRFTTAASIDQYGPDSTMKQGNWNCLHRITELNRAGWATVAELKVGDHAPIKLPDDARPRPHLKLESVEGEAARFTIVDPGFPEDGETWDTSEPRTIREVAVETHLLGAGDREGAHLLVIRKASVDSAADPIAAPTRVAAVKWLRTKRRIPPQRSADPKPTHGAENPGAAASKLPGERLDREVLGNRVIADLVRRVEDRVDQYENTVRDGMIAKLSTQWTNVAQHESGAASAAIETAEQALELWAVMPGVTASKIGDYQDRLDRARKRLTFVNSAYYDPRNARELLGEHAAAVLGVAVMAKLDAEEKSPTADDAASQTDEPFPKFRETITGALMKDPYGPRLNQADAEFFAEQALENWRAAGGGEFDFDVLPFLDGVDEEAFMEAWRATDGQGLSQEERLEKVLSQPLPPAREGEGDDDFDPLGLGLGSDQAEPASGASPPTGVDGSPITTAENEPQPVAKVSATRVDHTDGRADGKKSLGRSGHLIAAMEADLDKAERHLRNAEKLAATVLDLARADRRAGASGPRLVTKALSRRALTGLAPVEKLRSDVGNRLAAWVEGQMEAEEPLDEVQSESETIAARLEVLGKQAGELKRRIRNPFHILDEARDFPPGNWTAGHDGDLQDFNHGGWTALAELRLNQTAPLPATEGADPRPRIRLDENGLEIMRVEVIDPGGKTDRALIRLSGTANFIETRAGLVAIQHLPDAKSEQKGTALFILRAVPQKSAKLRDITAEQVRSALYKKPSKSVSTEDASRRRELSEEPAPLTSVEALPAGPQPVAKVSATRVDHTDGKADGKKSLGGSGHLIRFELPEGAAGVKAVRIHGSRYGTKAAPREDFEISFLSEDRSEILAVERVAYGLFRRGAEKWTTIRFKAPVVDLPETFWIAIDFAPGRTKGVYLSYDTSTDGSRSMTGLAQQEPNEHRAVTFEGDWMVSLVLERAEPAASTEPQDYRLVKVINRTFNDSGKTRITEAEAQKIAETLGLSADRPTVNGDTAPGLALFASTFKSPELKELPREARLYAAMTVAAEVLGREPPASPWSLLIDAPAEPTTAVATKPADHLDKSEELRAKVLDLLGHIPGVKVQVNATLEGNELKRADASVAVPMAYVKAIYQQQHPKESPIDQAKLEAVHSEVKMRVENLVVRILPELTMGENAYRQVAVEFIPDVAQPSETLTAESRRP